MAITGAPAHRPARPAARLNDFMATAMVAVVLLAPLPAGSNRPIFWLAWAAVLGLLFGAYFLLMMKLAPRYRFHFIQQAPLLLVGLSIPLAAILQTLPVAAALPAAITALPLAGSFAPDTLSLAPTATTLGVVRLLSYGVFFILMLEVSANASRAGRIAGALFLGISLHAIWALISLNLLGDSFFWGPKTAYAGSATGTFINRNSFAAFMGMGLILGLSLGFARLRRDDARTAAGGFAAPRTIERAVFAMGLMFILAALVASGSRMGMLAALAGAAVVLGLMVGLPPRRRAMVSARGIALGLLVIIAVIAGFGRVLIERSIFIVQHGETRSELYRQITGMILERPWSGYGLDSFDVAFELFHKPPLSSAVTWTHAHSTYLTYWAELGLIAGSLPIVFLALIAVRLAGVLRRRDAGFASASAAMGALCLGALHSLVDFPLEIQANVFLFLALLAMGLTPYRQISRPGRAPRFP